MPGPGGGSRGGGFGGGGRRGGGGFGSRPSGGFGGGFGGRPGGFRPRPHYRPRPYFGGGWHRPYRPMHYGGGGCLGGLMGMLMVPVIILIIVAIMLFGYVGSAVSTVASGGRIEYDEKAFQDYANQRYSEEFGSSSAYEDNLLIVFVTDDESEEFYCIAFIGDNVKTEINYMFGDETTEFGRAVMNSVNSEFYGYSLGSNLAAAVDIMTDEVVDLGLESSFRSKSDRSELTESHLTNYTELQISKETVNASLEKFTEETGIPAVIVVDTMENVFGKSFGFGDIMVMIILAALVILLIVWIVKAVRKSRNAPIDTDTDAGNATGL